MLICLKDYGLPLAAWVKLCDLMGSERFRAITKEADHKLSKIMSIKRNKTKKLRILIVVRWPVGGIRTFLRYVYSRFDSDKYEFTIVAPQVDEVKVLLKDLEKLTIHYLPVKERPTLKQFMRAITWEILNKRYHLIHSHGTISGICSAIGAFITNTPHIITLHEVFIDRQFGGWIGNIKKFFISIFFLQPDIIHLVSNDAKTNLLAHMRVLKNFRKKLVVIKHGIETERFVNALRHDFRKELGLTDDTFLIGFFGRFMSPKGFRYLINAVELLQVKHGLKKKLIVIAIGGGGFLNREIRYIKRRGLNNNFVFLPFMPDISSALKGVDVVAMPSIWEASGLLAAETLVSGVPLIATGCIGLREVVENTPATVIPPKDTVALAEALFDHMMNPKEIESTKYAIEAATRFNATVEANKIEKLVSTVIATKGGGNT